MRFLFFFFFLLTVCHGQTQEINRNYIDSIISIAKVEKGATKKTVNGGRFFFILKKNLLGKNYFAARFLRLKLLYQLQRIRNYIAAQDNK